MSEYFPSESEIDSQRELVLQQIQSTLGVGRDDAVDFMGVQVACPDPRGEGAAMELGDYLSSVHGAGNKDQLLDTARQAKDMGVSAEQSLRFALGIAAVVDKDTGMLARSARATLARSRREAEVPTPDSKKK